ncbi:RagB/SusD family nutrient uptake outer membrane protein [Arcticibacter eurypsychrophilus]|uniref:RagB/SusD family nutrient uptake outer membrane protein n=1 Tax=Arcticibacter eurypsychrophilus TaxID=1434752 RepID=UPI00084D1111|nr:RagB/SusD family nutrient uptake outer membrane protein [Arcticibacter eurypsychrophilus]
MKIKYIYIALSVAFLSSCTKLDENIYDKVPADEFFALPGAAASSLASVYAQMPGNWDGVGYAGADRGWYDLNEMSADYQVVPHRTTGDWELDFARLYKREWLPSDGFMNNTWNWLYKSIYRANRSIAQLETAKADPSAIAEAKVLRAFFYYLLIDDFGDVPFFTVNDTPVEQVPQAKRKEVYDFVVSELLANIDQLSSTKGGNYYGRFNKWAAYSLLAKVYLNAQVYTGTPMWNECLAACNKVSEGGFSLHSGAADASNKLGYKYYELFGDVLPDDETILAIYVTADIVGRNIFTVRSLGGTDGTNLFGAGAWNGSIVPQAFVEKFSNTDIRKRQFRYGANPYGPQPAGFINYSLEVLSLDNPGALPNAGARNQKFFPVAPISNGGSNDFPIYRYADILLMKAECNVRLGSAAVGKPFIDQVRERAGLNALTAAPTLDNIYDERGFELTWEGHRRQDMIRFGKFLLAHDFAPAVGPFRLLFPIPTAALNANKLLIQNPGY